MLPPLFGFVLNALGLFAFALFGFGQFASAQNVGGTPSTWGIHTGAAPAGLTNLIQAAVTDSHFVGLRADGTVAAWQPDRCCLTPYQPISNVVAVAANNLQSLALLNVGTVIQLGQSNVPIDVVGNVVAIAAQGSSTLLLRSNGTITAFGTATNNAPTAGGFKAVAVAAGFGMALRPDGTVVAWGNNIYSPTNVPNGLSNVSAIATDGSLAVALKEDGSVVGWNHSNPTCCGVPAGISNVIQIQVDSQTVYARTASGSLASWGHTFAGVWPGFSNILDVAVGNGSGCAIVRVDDAHPPAVIAANAGSWEWDSPANLKLRLSVQSYQPITINYTTRDATATAFEDYYPTSGTVTLPPNTLGTNLYVQLIDDIYAERNETIQFDFTVSNATLVTTQAFITIANDDKLALSEGFQISQIATGFANGIFWPTRMEFAPDGQLFVCAQQGNIYTLTSTGLAFVLHVPTTTEDGAEAGLLGLAFHPEFASNSYVYAYHTVYSGKGVRNRLTRYSLTDTNDQVIILDLDLLTNARRHNGGGLQFGPDGKLYIAVGDNGKGSNAQTMTNLLGKVLRINDDGSIPADNPFWTVNSGVNRAIWAKGLRNPYSIAFERGAGRMFITDVGEDTWEEINLGTSASDYGWPAIEGPAIQAGFANPLYAYGHGTNLGFGCAIIGGAFVPPTAKLPTRFQGDFFFADYCNGWIARLSTNGLSSIIAQGVWNPIDLKMGPDGHLYCLTRRTYFDGGIYRIAYVPSARIVTITKTNTSHVRIEAVVKANQTYTLETSSDLTTWSGLMTTNTVTTNLHFVDTALSQGNQKFYRIGQ